MQMQPVKNVSCLVHLFLFSELPSYGLIGTLGSMASVQMQPTEQDPIIGELGNYIFCIGSLQGPFSLLPQKLTH